MSKKEVIQQLELKFTNRIDAKEAFMNFKDQFHESNAYKVLAYYGILGVGKTRLLTEIKKDLKKEKYVCLDINEQEPRLMLLKLRTLLEMKLGFKFDIFNTALFEHARKSGDIIIMRNLEVLKETNKYLQCLFNFFDKANHLSLAENIYKIAKLVSKDIRKGILNRTEEIKQISNSSKEEIENNLHRYFAGDLESNIRKLNKPLIIFLDNYERISKDPLLDHWIWNKRDGLITKTPNVIWVLSSNNKLQWEKFESYWSNKIKYVELKELNDTETYDLLSNMGINDKDIQEHIYQLTGGLPIDIEFSYKQYNTVLSTNKKVTKEDLGNNLQELYQLFIKHTDKEEKDLAIKLSCIDEWTDDLITKLFEVNDDLSLSKIKMNSYVKTEDHVTYRMHEKVRDIFQNHCLVTTKQKINKLLADYYDNLLKQDYSDEYLYLNHIKHFIKYKLNSVNSEDEFLGLYDDVMIEYINGLKNVSLFKEVSSIYEIIINYCDETFGDSEITMDKYHDYSEILEIAGFYPQALYAGKKALFYSLKYKGEEDLKTIDILEDLSDSYHNMGRINESLQVAISALNLAIQVLGKEDEYTLSLIIKTSECYSLCGKFSEALQLAIEASELTEDLDRGHHLRIDSRVNLASCYSHLGNQKDALEIIDDILNYDYESLLEYDIISILIDKSIYLKSQGQFNEALAIAEEVYRKSKEFYGEEHQNTIVALISLMQSFITIGNKKKAFDLGTRVVETCYRILGKEHPNTIAANIFYSLCYFQYNKLDEAIKIINEQITLCYDLYGEENPMTLQAISMLSIFYNAEGKKEEAKELITNAIRQMQKVLGDTHPETILMLIFYCRDLGVTKDTLLLLEDILSVSQNILGEDHIYTILGQLLRANYYYYLKDVEKTIEIVQEEVVIASKALGEDNYLTINAITTLLNIYVNEKRYDDAIPLLENTKGFWFDLLKDGNLEIFKYMLILANCYRQRRRKEEALKISEELYAIALNIFDEDSKELISILQNLYMDYSNCGKEFEASQILAKTTRIMEETIDEEDLLEMSDLFEAIEQYKIDQNNPVDLLKSILKVSNQFNIIDGNENGGQLIQLLNDDRFEGKDEMARTVLNEMFALQDQFFNDDKLTISFKMLKNEYDPNSLEYAEKQLEISKNMFGDEDKDTIKAMIDLSKKYSEEKRYQEALDTSIEAFQLINKDNYLGRLSLKQLLVLNYYNNQNYQEALNHALELYNQIKDIQDGKYPDIRYIKVFLILIYYALGKIEKIKEFIKKNEVKPLIEFMNDITNKIELNIDQKEFKKITKCLKKLKKRF